MKMCLPQKFLKKFLGFSAILILIIGLAGVIAAYINLSKKENIWSNNAWDWGNSISGLLLALSLFATLTGLFGIIGGFKKNRFFLCFY